MTHIKWTLQRWLYFERYKWCWRCWRFVKQFKCQNCDRQWICPRHAEWETEHGDFGSVLATYPLCDYCEQEYGLS